MANYKHIILDADELMSILGKQTSIYGVSIDNNDVENNNVISTNYAQNNSDYVLFYNDSSDERLSPLEPGEYTLDDVNKYYTVIGGKNQESMTTLSRRAA